MTTPGEVSKFLDEVSQFVKAIVETHCKDCIEYRYGNNYECFCIEVLDMLEKHPKTIEFGYGYEDYVCKCWNLKQKHQSHADYPQC